MIQNFQFPASNNSFGRVLTSVMKAHHIAGDALAAECGMRKSRIYQIKKG